jgi:hypothetical protein
MNRIVIVCIAKDEDHYLEEWLDYNHKLGFDKIIMYQNNWRTDIERPFLEKIEWDGEVQQLPAYNHFIQNNTEYTHAAFIDCDEYIVLKKHNNIHELIQQHNNPLGLGLNWRYFGSMGKLERKGNSLLKQFTKRQMGVDRHIKVILNLQDKPRMILPHNANRPVLDTNGNTINGPFHPNGIVDVAYICHFHSKTYEDWVLRCKRGRADTKSVSAKIEEWDIDKQYNNEIEDLNAYNFMYNEK